MIWEVSISPLKQNNMLRTNPLLERFAWQAPVVMQWHAFIHILNSLRATPLLEKSGDVWDLIGSIYSNNPAMTHDMGKPLHVAVARLCLKAYKARVAALEHQGGSNQPTPGFISLLRAKLEGSSQPESQSQTTNNTSNTQPCHGGATQLTGKGLNLGATHPTPALHNTRLQSEILEDYAGVTPPTESYHPIEGFSDSQTGVQNHAGSLDPCDLTVQGGDAEMSAIAADNWEQWDRMIIPSMMQRSPSRRPQTWRPAAYMAPVQMVSYIFLVRGGSGTVFKSSRQLQYRLD
jgi:hypothetical protein